MTDLSRRGFIAALSGTLFMPAIARAQSLMRVRPWRWPERKYKVRIVARRLWVRAPGDDLTLPLTDAELGAVFGGHPIGVLADEDFRVSWQPTDTLPRRAGMVERDSFSPPEMFEFRAATLHDGWRAQRQIPQSSVKRMTLAQIDRWNQLRAHTGLIAVRDDGV
jgi:hypothetical protein